VRTARPAAACLGARETRREVTVAVSRAGAPGLGVGADTVNCPFIVWKCGEQAKTHWPTSRSTATFTSPTNSTSVEIGRRPVALWPRTKLCSFERSRTSTS
jgi:hypothetical protein